MPGPAILPRVARYFLPDSPQVTAGESDALKGQLYLVMRDRGFNYRKGPLTGKLTRAHQRAYFSLMLRIAEIANSEQL
jgi:hypothetical protein